MMDFCIRGFKGEIITRKNSLYNVVRQEWNRAIEKYPLAFLYCTDKGDIALALKFCIRNNIEFRVRSGGHNYEGFSTGNNLVVIDVSLLKKIKFSKSENSVEIECGVENSELYEFLGNKGYPFPGGTCPTVGVVGYTLGGGWGLSSRLFGLGCDNAIEFELINYKGECIVANKNINKDLFWALRGVGGGNLGIVYKIKYNLPPKFNNVTLFSIYYKDINSDEQVVIMDKFQQLYIDLDRRANMRASFYNSVDEGVASYIFGLFYGNKEEIEDILKDFLVLPKAESNFKYTTFIEAIREVENGYPSSEKFKSTGRFSDRIYNYNELIDMAKIISVRPQGSVFVGITFYGLGGAVKDKGKEETAFYYRDSNFIIGIQSIWEDSKYAEINKEWVMCKFKFIKKITTGSYINFPIYPLKSYKKEYYGENLFKLKNINNKYNPLDIFNFQQGLS
ncbi:FAD-binding protein [Clostridium sp.]|uniref:FAD-dependent oxidoreductase n=1 Tax=Clostridium sp. TaxID=1506 RepID=UPI003F3C7B8F